MGGRGDAVAYGGDVVVLEGAADVLGDSMKGQDLESWGVGNQR